MLAKQPSFNLSSIDFLHEIMTIILFCNHNTITNHVEETYLDKFERIWRSWIVWVSFCAGSQNGRAPPKNGRAHCISRACVVLYGEELTKKSRTTQVVAHTWGMVAHLPKLGICCKLPKSLSCLSPCNFLLPNAQWGFSKREFTFICFHLKKI